MRRWLGHCRTPCETNVPAPALRATAAAVDAPPDYARVLRRHYREAATVYDWTDHDLPDMIIADLPARRVLADGPL